MASNTEYLGLLMKDPAADKSDTFNIETMLNENWRKIDAAFPELISLIEGRAQVVSGAYVGTGVHGEENQNTLEFEFVPKLVLILYLIDGKGLALAWLVNPLERGSKRQETGGGAYDTYVQWDDNNRRVSWYVPYEVNAYTSSGPSNQCNALDVTYHYIAIG